MVGLAAAAAVWAKAADVKNAVATSEETIGREKAQNDGPLIGRNLSTSRISRLNQGASSLSGPL
jgi:hypothetical protein